MALLHLGHAEGEASPFHSLWLREATPDVAALFQAARALKQCATQIQTPGEIDIAHAGFPLQDSWSLSREIG